MSAEQTSRARYRFDPHDEGIWMGLGLVRLSMVCGSMLAGALCVYGGRILPALVLLLVVPPLVLARWDGLPLLAWLPLRALYRLHGPTTWAIDPEHAGFTTPLSSWVPAITDTSDTGGDVDEDDDHTEALHPHDDVDDAVFDAPPLGDTPDENDEDDLWHS